MLKKLFGLSKPSSLVEQAFQDIGRMLQQASSMFDHSLGLLLDNRELEVDLEEMDEVINEAERMVRRGILEHLVVSPRNDLAVSLVLASIVQDAERIGDFARGLADIAALANQPRSGPFADDLRALALRLRPLFEQCEVAFCEGDPEKARALESSHRQLKADLIEFVRQVTMSDLSADMAVVYSTGATMIRRMSSHLSNIVSTEIQPYDRIRHDDEQD
jgi:phosphate transport system protein